MAILYVEEGNDHIWYVDIRATSHVSHDIESFKTYDKLSNNQVMYLGVTLHIKYLVKKKILLN